MYIKLYESIKQIHWQKFIHGLKSVKNQELLSLTRQ